MNGIISALILIFLLVAAYWAAIPGLSGVIIGFAVVFLFIIAISYVS